MSLLDRLRARRRLRCEDANAFLAEYFDDALDRRTRERFDEHVDACPQCSAYLAQYAATIGLVRRECSGDGRPPQEVIDHTLEFLEKRLQSEL